jgi:glycogen operon protein
VVVLGELERGRHEPLGAHACDGGVNFAVAAQAEAVELCLLDDAGRERRLRLHGPVDGVFHGFLPGASAGLVYQLRARGELLRDPYAREPLVESRDRAAPPPKARVAAPLGEAPGFATRPRHRDADLLLYEVHAKGFSKLQQGIPEELRGTFGALAHPAAIAHFQALGVNALVLLPVQLHQEADALAARGLHDYWGRDTLSYFTPEPRYARDPAAAAAEFREMVAVLHAAGIEVLAELSLRGLDPADPRGSQLLLDAMRFWMRDMGVDGFRFEAAAGLAAQAHFFYALRQDPILAGARLLAADRDRLGNLAGRLHEANAGFRDAARGYWLRRGVDREEFARRFTASADRFPGRPPTTSVNFIAAHEGFSLADLVSYSRPHNDANGDDAGTGADEACANLGVEGPTDDRLVTALRRRLRRAMMATLLLAQGTPMLCAGDEIGRTQGGNNDAWCQDNATSWLDWAAADASFCQFTAEAATLRRTEPLLHHERWFGTTDGTLPGLRWLLPAGGAPAPQDWRDAQARALGCLLDTGVDLPAEGSARLLLLFNPEPQEVGFALPEGDWRLALDSSGVLTGRPGRLPPTLAVPAHALLLLRPPPANPNPLGKK